MAEVEQSFGEQEVDEVPKDLEVEEEDDEEEQEEEGEEEEEEEEDGEEEEEDEEAPENSEVPVDAEIPENYEIPVVILPEEKEEHESEEAAVGGSGGVVVGGAEPEPERKWPGWPGESVFRMLVPAQKVGSIIGRKGEFIKKIVEETRARIKILDGPPGTAERAVMVSGKEEPDSSLPPAMDGLLRVHKRIVDGLDGDGSQPPLNAGVKVSTRLLVPASQAGSLIGKQGATVKSIQESSNCIVRVLGAEDLPVFALHEDRVVEVVGEPTDVHKAIELIGSHLRKFLVDRSIIPVFEMQMQMASPQMDPMPPPPPHQSWGPPQGHAGGGPGYVHNPPPPPPQYMQPPRQHDNYYLPPAADIPPQMDKQPHHGILAYGREAPIGGHGTTNAQPASAMGSLVTQQMQIPLSYADAVIGTSGASISYIRRASGSTVTIQESRANSTEMTVEISGSLSQVQTAQQLIHNFMADAAAAAAAGGSAGAQAQPAPAADQGGYNSYAAHGSVYASSPNNAGTGGYGSVYGTNYGY